MAEQMEKERPSRSFRIVARGAGVEAVEALLRAQGFEFEPDPVWPQARRLTREPMPLGHSIAWNFGRVYVQDRSSMLPPLALNPPPGAAVLDMCASPGSKTGMLAQMVGAGGLVFGVEPQPGRLAVLRANLRRMGFAQAVTAAGGGESLPFAPGSFPYILLDPPCSGWGTLDKNPRADQIWTGERVEPLLRIQRVLLARAAELLAPGGRLVFSTCTTNVDENEANTRWAMDELGLEPVPLAPPPGLALDEPLLGLAGVWRVPLTEDGQGFYVCSLRRPGGAAAAVETSARALALAEDGDVAEAGGGVEDGAGLGTDDGCGFFEPTGRDSARGRGRGGRKRGARDDGRRAETRRGEDRRGVGRLAGPVDFAALETPEALDLSALPEGEVLERGGQAVFLPRWASAHVPGEVRWEGVPLGRVAGGAFKPDAHARALIAESAEPGARGVLDVEDAEPLAALLAGQGLAVGQGRGAVALRFRGLRLGWLTRKGARLLWGAR